MRLSRRSTLKAGGIAMATLAASGVTTAKRDTDQQSRSLRLRGSHSEPLNPEEIQNAKRDLENEFAQALNTVEGAVADTDPSNLDQKRIVAYNFDIINGVPSQWIGTVDQGRGRNEPPRKPEPQNGRKSYGDPAASVRNQAEADAERKDQLTGHGETRDKVTTADLPDISDWNAMYHDTLYHETSSDNSMHWELFHVANPTDFSTQAFEIDCWVKPDQDTGWTSRNWRAEEAHINMDFADDYDDHGPGNTIGSNTSYFEIGTDPDSVIAVTYGESVTNSNLQIDDKSFPWSDNVEHEYDFDGDLRENYIEFNMGGMVTNVTANSGSTFCDFRAEGGFEKQRSFSGESVWYDNRLEWL